MKSDSGAKLNLFIVAGMPRGGTTTLYHHFQKHPSIYVPFRKEPSFFSYNYSKGLNWYKELYKEMRHEQIGADIGTFYFLDDKTIERIKNFDKEIKVILSVRDPVEYALSIYTQRKTLTFNMPPFCEFIKSYHYDEGPCQIHLELKDNTVPMIIEKYRNAFGDSLLLYNFDVFRKDPLAVLQAIESFVGVSNYYNKNNFENIIINAGNRKNLKVVTALLKNERLISLLNATLPDQLIRYLRTLFDRKSASKALTGVKYPDEDVRLAEEVFADQRAAVKDLFSESDIILGSGRPFPAV